MEEFMAFLAMRAGSKRTREQADAQVQHAAVPERDAVAELRQHVEQRFDQFEARLAACEAGAAQPTIVPAPATEDRVRAWPAHYGSPERTLHFILQTYELTRVLVLAAIVGVGSNTQAVAFRATRGELIADLAKASPERTLVLELAGCSAEIFEDGFSNDLWMRSAQ